MAREITVSVLGRRTPYSVDVNKGYRNSVDEMKGHLKREIDLVLPNKSDLIVLPEACDRPMNLSGSERKNYFLERGTIILDFYKEIARDNNCYIAYSSIREVPDGTFRNSTMIIDRNGKVIGVYNKNHVVHGERIQQNIYCGEDAPLIECDFGTIGCAICFDLNFEPIMLKYVEQRPDLIVFSSNYHGGIMQNYWAYSCRAYFISAFGYGQSTIVSPVGETIGWSTSYFDYFTQIINLDYAVVHLDYNWDKLRALKEKYGTGVSIHDPSHLGAVLISSELEGVSVKTMVEEFEIELLDDYMARSLDFHRDNVGRDFAETILDL